MSRVGDTISEEELFGVDLKIEQIGTSKFDLSVDRNGDLALISGRDYIQQRVIHVLFTRVRFYPIQDQELITNNITLRDNMDEAGRHFIPADLEELGYPEYGSMLSYLIGEPNTPLLKSLVVLYVFKAIALEYENGVEEIVDFKLTDIPEGFSIDITLRLLNNKVISISRRFITET